MMAQKESSSTAKKPRRFPRSIAGMLSITGEFISQSSFGNVVQVIYRIWFLASFELGCNKLNHLNEMKFWNDWICASLFRYGIKGFKCMDYSNNLPEFETWLVITDLSRRVLLGFKLAELALKPPLVLILWREEENSTPKKSTAGKSIHLYVQVGGQAYLHSANLDTGAWSTTMFTEGSASVEVE